MEHNTLQGVIFDLDGTLLDSTGVWSQVDRQILTHYQRPIPPDISDVVRKMSIGESSRYFVEQFDLPCTPALLAQQVSDMAAEEYELHLQLKPHALELLDYLDRRGVVYGVATATYGALAQAALKRLGIWERLQFLLTEQEVGAPKTNPLIFRKAAQILHLGKRQIVVAEDSLHCIETARTAGFFTVGVYDEASRGDWTKMKATATVHVKDLQEMAQYF